MINETLGGFRFTEAEAEEFSPHVVGEIERRLPAFLTIATIAGLLPLILRRSRAFFLSQGVPLSDVSELESKLAVKVLDQLYKGNLPSNASAWSKNNSKDALYGLLTDEIPREETAGSEARR